MQFVQVHSICGESVPIKHENPTWVCMCVCVCVFAGCVWITKLSDCCDIIQTENYIKSS